MLKQLILENWKSFRYAELPLDPLTVLIGTNASGKSNVVEALEFLKRIAQGANIDAALAGDKILPSIRGGVDWAALKPETQFTLKALVAGEDDQTDYLYVMQITTIPEVFLIEKYIERKVILNETKIHIERYTLKSIIPIDPRIFIDYSDLEYNNLLLESDDGKIIDSHDATQIYLPLKNKAIKFTFDSLKNILILDPIPSKMREYSRLSDTLESDASNIAGVLAALPDDQKTEIESTLSAYLKELPEGDIQKVWAEKVGRLGTDAMLYCEEEWKPGQITEIDARSMSDGTLRFLAIITALLTRPEGSQIVIEEIDNGLHPSRAQLLVSILREIGTKRKIDILLTTHNPALLDALGPEIVPFVVVAHRDSETGESKLTLLEDIENLPLLLASGTLGRLATKGAIERSLSDKK
ncbi:MAG: AAA family ATPase [Gloeotrichia echinulata GP01]